MKARPPDDPPSSFTLMPRPRFIVGIDLGTTNCAVAYVDTKGRERPTADIKTFEIPQLVAAGETSPRVMLPSFLYLPGPHELPPGAAQLPWSDDNDRIVGEFARIQGGRVPAHLVSSAKSWLCHPGVDREADILPWGSPAEARKVSPVEASRRLSAAYSRCLGCFLCARRSGSLVGKTGSGFDRARLVRRGRPRVDRRGRQTRRFCSFNPAGRTPGRVLLLDRHASGRLAEAGSRG